MTRILAIEGTDTRMEIEDCDTCPCKQWSEAPDIWWCGLTDEFGQDYDFHKQQNLPERQPPCPLPEKADDTRMVCPVCGANAICLNCKPKRYIDTRSNARSAFSLDDDEAKSCETCYFGPFRECQDFTSRSLTCEAEECKFLRWLKRTDVTTRR